MRGALVCVMGLCLAACSGQQAPAVPPAGPSPVAQAPEPAVPAPAVPGPTVPPGPPTYDVDRLGLPRFVTADYIDLAPILRISRFRSGEGHDYADQFETCRSMKHYFRPRSDADWSSIPIFAPATGSIVHLREEWAGTQVHVGPTDYPAFRIVIFHVRTEGLVLGQRVQSGQRLGTHIGSQTWSDVAVSVDTPSGFQLVSWFDVMTDEVFAKYQTRGLAQRGDAIIGRAARDASPLSCSGSTFSGPGSLANWVDLR